MTHYSMEDETNYQEFTPSISSINFILQHKPKELDIDELLAENNGSERDYSPPAPEGGPGLFCGPFYRQPRDTLIFNLN